MSRFATTKRGTTKTKNYEGADAYTMTPEMELYSVVSTTVLSNQFYRKADEAQTRISDLVKKVDPEFTARLAVYARTKMELRTIPILLLVELAKIHNGDNLVSRAVRHSILRADEIVELLSCYQALNSKNTLKVNGKEKKLRKISNQILKGLESSFNRFDEYQFAKYNKATEVSLKDALFLVHPKAKNAAQQILFDKIVGKDGLKLEVPKTWETTSSKVGQKKFETEEAKEEAQKDNWEDMIDSGKLPYMALLRNLRNILNYGVSANHIEKICKKLSDPREVIKSKQFPFRFLSAYKELSGNRSSYASNVLDALENAVLASADTIKGFDINTKVVVAADVSSSMFDRISPKSTVMRYDIGLMLAMLLQCKCKNVITGIFGDIWKRKALPRKSILSNVMHLKSIEGEVGYSTNGHLVISDLLKSKEIVDKVMIFTDGQLWNSKQGANYYSWSSYDPTNIRKKWSEYKKIAPRARLYLFDLAGYGTTPISLQENGVSLISGWSDKIFNMLDSLENCGNIVEEIYKIKI